MLEMMIPGQHDCRHNQDDSHLQLADIYQATHQSPPVIVMKVISPGPLISLIKTLRHLPTFLRRHQLTYTASQPAIGHCSSGLSICFDCYWNQSIVEVLMSSTNYLLKLSLQDNWDTSECAFFGGLHRY